MTTQKRDKFGRFMAASGSKKAKAKKAQKKGATAETVLQIFNFILQPGNAVPPRTRFTRLEILEKF